ncbi:hypothetical protein BH09CHL1_BH09CHL1_02050 [soil metagenome]
MHSLSRRTVLSAAIALGFAPELTLATTSDVPILLYELSKANPAHRYDPDDFNVVGIYDFDWLLTPEFERMLDLMASSPGAIGGVRAFGIFTMGEREDLKPGTGGVVWTDPAKEPDFTLPFEALDQLVRRGLTAFISLGFFPPAVSSSPITPPANFANWKRLITAFLSQLTTDERFGAEAIKSWSFEVWNEPNEGRFWIGSFEQYLDLYRATSEAIQELGLRVRLGGPAMAYKPESEADDGQETMTKFLDFLRDEPNVLCDFISYHRKGTVDSSPPDPYRLRNAALEISDLIEAIVPERAAALTLINNEADEKIGFETPYLPRMGSFAASWLTTLSTAHASLAMEGGRRFSAVQDNANLQLMQTSFDGRRSIYSFLSTDNRSDLVKTSGAIFYDLLPMLGGAIVPPRSTDAIFPNTELHSLCTISDHGMSLLVTWHPVGDSSEAENLVGISITDFPWPVVTYSRWRIDESQSNGYATAEKLNTPEFTAADAVVIRGNQELSLEGSTQHYIETDTPSLSFALVLAPFDTVMVWITPKTSDTIESPTDVRTRELNGGTELSWIAVEHNQLLGYEIARNGETIAGPIRPCSWIDSIAIADATYAVRAISTSGIESNWVSAAI